MILAGNQKINYIYSASGEKLACDANGSLTYYRSVMVYGSDNKLLYMLTSEGTVSRSEGSAGTSYTYNYFKTDHLGSTRVMLSAVDRTLQASQTTDFYPFGLAFEYSNLNKNRYLFSGKELQDGLVGSSMLEWYDFGARFYDPVLGRWFNVDPAAQVANPYLFCGNAPMMYIDKDGRIFWMIPAIAIGAAIGAASYTLSVALSPGGFDNWNWGGFFQSIGIGAVSGAVTSGIGKIFGDIGKFGTEVARGFTHGVVQGGFSSLQGGDFLSGFASGTLSSFVGSTFQVTGIGHTKVGMYALGGISGGIGAAVTGGNFWKGMGQGMIITGLNHAAHLTKSFFEKNILFGDKPAYRAMNRISERTGNEVAAHEVEMETKGLFGRKIIKKGVLIYDYSDNEPHASSYPVKYDNNGKYITNFKGQTYEVKGLVHTHTTNIGVSDADIHAQRLFKNPIKMLFNRQVYELNIQQNRYVPTGVTY